MNKQHNHKPQKLVEVCECGAVRERGGAWGQRPFASYLDAATPEERSERSSLAAKTRWAALNKRERKKIMRAVAQAPRPGRRSQDRCPCGRYTRYTAEKRAHKCEANEGETE